MGGIPLLTSSVVVMSYLPLPASSHMANVVKRADLRLDFEIQFLTLNFNISTT